MTVDFLSAIDPAQALQHVSALVSGAVGLWAFVWLNKKLAPWLKGRTAILRLGGVIVSALGVFLAKAATGALEGADWQTLLVSVLDAAAVWFGAHSIHKATKLEKNGGETESA